MSATIDEDIIFIAEKGPKSKHIDCDSSSEFITTSDNRLIAVDKKDMFFQEFRKARTMSLSSSPPSPSSSEDRFYGDDTTDGGSSYCRLTSPKMLGGYKKAIPSAAGRPLASSSLQFYSGGYSCGGRRSTLSRAEMTGERKRILGRVPSSRSGKPEPSSISGKPEGQGPLRVDLDLHNPKERFRKLTGILRKKWFILLKCCGVLALQKLKALALLFAPGLILAGLIHLIYFLGSGGSESLLLGLTSSTMTINGLQHVELPIPKSAPVSYSQDLSTFQPIYPENDLNFLMGNSSSECQQRNDELQEENTILEEEISGLRQQFVDKLVRKEGQFLRFKRAVSIFRQRHFCFLDIHVYLALASFVIMVNFLIYCFARHFY